MPELRAPAGKPSIFERLQSADLSLLARKLQEKEQPEQPIFPEDGPLNNSIDAGDAERRVAG